MTDIDAEFTGAAPVLTQPPDIPLLRRTVAVFVAGWMLWAAFLIATSS